MASVIHLFVESEGVLLPDGSVFGAGVTLVYDIVHNEDRDRDDFRIYFYSGSRRVMVADPMRYREMRAWVCEQIQHYNSHGFKLWAADHCEWAKVRQKKQLVTESDF